MTVATHQAIQKAFQVPFSESSRLNYLKPEKPHLMVGFVHLCRLRQHITKHVKNWSKYETDWGLWDPNKKTELKRLVDRRPNLIYFDVYISAYSKASIRGRHYSWWGSQANLTTLHCSAFFVSIHMSKCVYLSFS